jgi:hypothetical protein
MRTDRTCLVQLAQVASRSFGEVSRLCLPVDHHVAVVLDCEVRPERPRTGSVLPGVDGLVENRALVRDG